MASIPVTQINLHHSVAGSVELCARLEKMRSYIALLQEPWVVGRRICGLPAKGLVAFGGKQKVRACVVASPDIRVWPLPMFSDRDCAAVSTRWQVGEIIFASVYMPGDGDIPSNVLRLLVGHCESRGIPLVIGCDANAHHTLWGSTNVNPRGEQLLGCIMGTQLEVVNHGNVPTFVNAIREEVLDLTLVTTLLLDRVVEWRVDQNASHSDHRYILFKIRLSLPDPIYYRNRRKTDWGTFMIEVKGKLAGVSKSKLSTIGDIEDRVNTVSRILKSTFHDACPLKRVRPYCPNKRFWKPELTSMRQDVRKLNRQLIQGRVSHEVFAEAQRAYKKAVRAAKRESWRGFVGEVKTQPQASCLYRLLTNDTVTQLGSIKLSDGTFTDGPEETLDHLLSIHFPSDPNRDVVDSEDHDMWDLPELDEIVSTRNVMRAIRSFGLYKAAGPDEIFPALLIYAGSDLVEILTQILRSCLSLGYVPRLWRQTRAAFIPKPGKDSYSLATSWRPISLTSFMVKVLERLVDWHLRTPTLVEGLKAAGQCAYLKGSSTDVALHRFVAVAEKALKSQEFALGALLDIAGAFSHATHRSLILAMRRENLSELCVRWVGFMLRNRSAEASVGDIRKVRTVERGCPQGGVLSPLLWNLLVSEVLTRLKRRLPQLLSQAFADDLGLMQIGPDISTVSDLVQQGLDVVSQWCKEVDLGVEAQKSQVIVFTRRILFTLRPLRLNGIDIPLVKEVKYLGVVLDSTLSWLPHCKARARKCQIALAQCKRALGKTWGLSPRISYWLYTVVIRPTLCYGALVWLPAVYKSAHMLILEKVQRLALVGICGVMRSTPTAAMECLLDLPPLDLYMEGLALKTMYRLKRSGQWLNWAGQGNLNRQSHIDICTRLSRKVPEMELPCDHETSFLPEPLFSVAVPSRSEWEGAGSPVPSATQILCYTDGSRLEQSTGSGFYIPHPIALWKEAVYPLGRYTTVPQAELHAILNAAMELRATAPSQTSVTIYADCYSAIQALISHGLQGRQVYECVEALNDLGRDRALTLKWIPAHQGYSGNEHVDGLAKEGAETPFFGPEPVIPVSPQLVPGIIDTQVRERHRIRWTNWPECRQSKKVMVAPNRGNRRLCLGLSRGLLRILTQLVTGHCLLAHHLFKIGVETDPTCPLCKREDETRDHFVCSCEALCEARSAVLGKPFLQPEELASVSLPSLLKYSLRTKRFKWNKQGDNSTQ